MDVTQFRKLIVVQALTYLGLASTAAIQMVMGTIAQESRFQYLHQLGKGPALGLGQMEPATHDSLWHNYLAYHHPLAALVRHLVPGRYLVHWLPDSLALEGSLEYAVAMIRVKYYREKEPLPRAFDWKAQAEYYKKYYNTAGGAATVDEYLRNYRHYVGAS